MSRLCFSPQQIQLDHLQMEQQPQPLESTTRGPSVPSGVQVPKAPMPGAYRDRDVHHRQRQMRVIRQQRKEKWLAAKRREENRLRHRLIHVSLRNNMPSVQTEIIKEMEQLNEMFNGIQMDEGQ